MKIDQHNLGHGHVFPRADGVVARCGGPAICTDCARDKARKDVDDAKERADLYSGKHPDFDERMKEAHKLRLHREPNWIEVKRDLSSVLNRHSLDVHQGTPDFLLADFLVRSLQLHREFIIERQRWFKGVEG